MAISGGSDSPDGKTRYTDYVEANGKLQPKPQGTAAGLTITEETLWKDVEKGFLKK